jgi:hypothetical protein
LAYPSSIVFIKIFSIQTLSSADVFDLFPTATLAVDHGAGTATIDVIPYDPTGQTNEPVCFEGPSARNKAILSAQVLFRQISVQPQAGTKQSIGFSFAGHRNVKVRTRL